MRIVWLLFAGILAAMVLLLPRQNQPATRSVAPAARANGQPLPAQPVSNRPRPAAAFQHNSPTSVRPTRADSLVAFGLAQQGAPYVYAGTSPLLGFDCSGFILYTFAHFHVAVPHSTALLIGVGQPVPRTEAQPGDIVVFTGTAPTSTTPGHAGIVVSGRGQIPLRFVHSSSARRESGVKVSQVEGSDYERRFLQIRRMPGLNNAPTDRDRLVVAARKSAPIAALPVHPVPLTPKANPPFYPPKIRALKSRQVPGRLKIKGSKKTAMKPTRPITKKTARSKAGRKAPVKASRASSRPGR